MVGNDLAAYYQAVVSFWKGADPYLASDFWNFIYPPGFLAVFFWLPLVPFRLVGFVWLIVSLFCLWFVVGVLATKKILYRTVVFCLVLAWFPVRFNLLMGQVNLIVLAASVLFYLLLARRNSLAGVVLGLMVTIKVSPLLFIFWLVRLKLWKETLVCLVTIVMVNLLVVLRLPTGSISDFMQITNGGLFAESTYYFNQSFVAALTRVFTFEGGAMVSRVIGLGLFFYVVYLTKRVSLASFCLILLAVTMVSPVAWQHHLVGLIPAILFLLRRGKRLIWTVVGTILAGLNLTEPSIFLKFEPIYSHGAVGGLILLVLLIMAVTEEERGSYFRRRE